MSEVYSIIIPTFNEESYIENCIQSLTKNKLFDLCEILIIDGGSKDKTLDIIKSLQIKYNNIFLLKNKKKITPAALNIGIKFAKGKFIIRLDAHAEYCENYIDKTVYYLNKSEKKVLNIGGYIITKNKDDKITAKTISIVLSSFFGVGNSIFRIKKPAKSTYVDTVPFGGFKQEAFSKIGLFNESEPRNEDLEFNYRIRKLGYKIMLEPDLWSIYYSRNDLSSFVNQAFDNGFIVTKNISKGEIFHNIRHFVPLFFSIFIILLLFGNFFLVNNFSVQFLNIIFLFYITVSFSFSIVNSLISKKLYLIFSMPIIYFILHFVYGLGSIKGLLSSLMNIFLNKK